MKNSVSLAVCVSLSFTVCALGVTITKDVASSSVVLENFNGSTDPSTSLKRVTHDSTVGGAATYSYAASSSPEGYITYGSLNNSFDPATHSYLRARMAVDRNNASTTAIQVYPTPVIGGQSVTEYISSGTALAETSFDLSSLSPDGNGVRIDAFNYTNDGTLDQCKLDYLMADMGRTIGFEFDLVGDVNDALLNNITDDAVADGVLSGTSGADSQIVFHGSAAPDVDGDIYKYVEIRMKGSAGNRIDFFWDTDSQDGGATRVELDSTVSADDNYHTYLLDFTDEAGWTGDLTFLRLDPVSGSGADFEVDYVRFLETVPEPVTIGLLGIGGLVLFVRRRFFAAQKF
jgi:hypothetical protein